MNNFSLVLDNISTILLIFFIYSFAGWIWESFFMGIYEKKITNRGFLNGPYIPIYGFGGTIMYYSLNNFQDNIFLLFILGFIFATILEYITALVLENILKIRLWTYDNYPLNFQGRICLIASLFWGVLAIVVVKYTTPFILNKLNLIHRDLRLIISSSLLTIFIFDLIITINSMYHLKDKIKNIIEIEEKINMAVNKKEIYKHNSLVFKRITKAFPNLKFKTEKEQNIFDKLKELNKKIKK